MRISKDIIVTLTDEEQRVLEQAESILDKLSDLVTDNDLADDYDFSEAYSLLENIIAQDGRFNFKGEGC